MQRVLILGRKQAGEKNDVVQLAAGLQKQAGEGMEIVQGYLEDLVFFIDENPQVQIRVSGRDQPIGEFAHIIFLHWTIDRVFSDIAHAAALFASKQGVTLWNSELTNARSMTKLSQLMLLTLNGHYVPKSVFSLNGDAVIEAGEALLPLVYKDITASRGRNNELVESAESLQATVKRYDGKPMIAQAFVANDKSDLRFFVSGGKVMLAIRRKGADDSHLNNISAGGSADIVPLETFEPSVLTEVEAVVKLFNRELCGIDYIYDQGSSRYVFLEINGTPQIVNGAFPDEKLAAIITSLETLGEQL